MIGIVEGAFCSLFFVCVFFVLCSLFVCSFVIPAVLSVCTVQVHYRYSYSCWYVHTLVSFLYDDIINVSNLVERGRRKKSRKEGSEGRKNRRDERRQATWEFYFFP